MLGSGRLADRSTAATSSSSNSPPKPPGEFHQLVPITAQHRQDLQRQTFEVHHPPSPKHLPTSSRANDHRNWLSRTSACTNSTGPAPAAPPPSPAPAPSPPAPSHNAHPFQGTPSDTRRSHAPARARHRGQHTLRLHPNKHLLRTLSPLRASSPRSTPAPAWGTTWGTN